MDNADEFLADMQGLRPDIVDYFEALVFAMEHVDRIADGKVIRYFGAVGGGTFYGDADFDRCRWFPDTTPMEAVACLKAEFDDEFTEGLEPF